MCSGVVSDGEGASDENGWRRTLIEWWHAVANADGGNIRVWETDGKIASGYKWTAFGKTMNDGKRLPVQYLAGGCNGMWAIDLRAREVMETGNNTTRNRAKGRIIKCGYQTVPKKRLINHKHQCCASGSGWIRNYLQVRIRIRNKFRIRNRIQLKFCFQLKYTKLSKCTDKKNIAFCNI